MGDDSSTCAMENPTSTFSTSTTSTRTTRLFLHRESGERSPYRPFLHCESKEEAVQFWREAAKGQEPCVEIDGNMLTDVSGEEVEAYMLANSIVQGNDREADAPTNQPCENEMQGSEINFR